MTYFMYRDAKGEWRWYLQTANGRKIAESGEGYRNKEDCRDMIELVQLSECAQVFEGAPQNRYELSPLSRGLPG